MPCASSKQMALNAKRDVVMAMPAAMNSIPQRPVLRIPRVRANNKIRAAPGQGTIPTAKAVITRLFISA